MLATVVCATLCGARGYKPIAQWLHAHPVDVWHLLGYLRRPPKWGAFRKLLQKIDVAELSMIANTPAEVDTETGRKVLQLMEALDDHDDVQSVYTNMNITDEMAAGV